MPGGGTDEMRVFGLDRTLRDDDNCDPGTGWAVHQTVNHSQPPPQMDGLV